MTSKDTGSAGAGSERKGAIRRFWWWLWHPSRSIPLAVLLIVGAVGGLVVFGVFNGFIEWASTEKFCITCHEMRANPYADLTKTVHFSNPAGTRAICTNCHIPKEFVPKIVAKTLAIKDLVFHIAGKLDTPEKYAANKLELAIIAWKDFKANDSQNCRNCHQNVWTDTKYQWGAAARLHKQALAAGNVTCIDCHQGIAHTPPKEFVRPPYQEILSDPNAWLVRLEKIEASGQN